MGGGLALTANSTGGALTGPNKSPVATNFPLSSDISDNQEDDSPFASLFVSVPSPSEVKLAISSLQSLMQGVSLCGTELSWLQPILTHYGPTLTQSPGFQRLKDALLLLQTNPSIQRLVLSISSDKSVWDAVLKNKLVRQVSESLGTAILEGSPGDNKGRDAVASIMRWILDMMKAKVVELVDKLRSLVDEIFDSPHPQKDNMSSDVSMEQKLKSSVLLSIIILLIVVVTRASHLP